MAAVHLPEWHPEAHPVGEQATVADVMTREVPSVPSSVSVEQTFDVLVSSAHKRIVVIDNQRHPVGIVADSDLISRVCRESWPGMLESLRARIPVSRINGEARRHLQRLRGKSVEALMTRGVITVHEKNASRKRARAVGRETGEAHAGGQRQKRVGRDRRQD